MSSQPTPRPQAKPQPDAKVQPVVRAPTTPLPGLDIVSTNDLATGQRQRRRTVLYKGIPLTGKTYCIGSWATAGPMLYILWDPKSETIEQFHDVFIIAPRDVHQFRDEIIPRILAGTITDLQGHKVDYTTVAVDSLSFYAKGLELDYMTVDVGGKKVETGEMPDGAWQLFANAMSRDLGRLGTVARSHSVPHPAHFVASIHEVDRFKQVRDARGQKQQVVDGTLPMISGQLRNSIEGYFDLTLLTCKETVGLPGNPQIRETRYFCRTIGTEKKQAAGGGFGGLKTLPPRVDGTYPGLCKLAGVDPRTLLPLGGIPPTTQGTTVSEEPDPDPEEGEATGTNE